MKILTTALMLTAVLGLASSARAETCGEMMASKAVLPEGLARTMTAVADMTDAHIAFMQATNKTPESKKEVAGLKKVSKEHRDLAKGFTKAAATLKGLATLPGADHDMEKMMADPKIQESMKEMLASHKAMVALLQKEVAEMEAMGKAPKK